jgi:hypothetical protein
MPRPSINLDPYRDEVQRRILHEKYSHKDVMDWLATQGVTVNMKTLTRRCKAWGASRRTTTSTTDPGLVDAIRNEYHSTTKNDKAIAEALSSRGTHTTCNQVKTIRLTHGWRRRAANADQRAEQRRETFKQVGGLLAEGPGNSGGREFVEKALRQQHQFRAREADIREALRVLDAVGTATRRPGPSKNRRTKKDAVPATQSENLMHATYHPIDPNLMP